MIQRAQYCFWARQGCFPARRKILEHETQPSALTFFWVLERNSTEQLFFIVFRQFPTNAVHQYVFQARLRTNHIVRFLLRIV